MTSKDASGQKSLTLELSLVGKMLYKHRWESVSSNYIYNWAGRRDSSQNMDDGGVSEETDNWCGKGG